MKSPTKQRIWSLVLILALLLTVLPLAALADTVTDPAVSSMTTFVFNNNSVTVTNGGDTNYEVVVYDSTDVDTAATAATSGNSTVYSLPSGSSGELKVAIDQAGGSYVFKGSGKGNITVKKAATGDSNLYLNGLTLTSSFTSVITVNKDSTAKCKIHVMGGTTNTLTDAAVNNGDTNTSNLAAENAVIKCKAASNMTIIGNGTLNITGNAKNGIKANSLLTIGGSVKLNITAAEDGISGETAVVVNSGTLNITAKAGDGIKCGADAAATGDIIINGGTITIDAYGDGMQATSNLTVNGGVLDITCYGGYTANYNSSSTSYPSAKGLKAGGTYLNASGTEAAATECYLKINGGYITINSADDAIHSDKEVTITAGVLDLYTAGDGVHADYTNTIGGKGADNTDLYLSIHKCYEGIEGANIYIHSGIINVFASDDSINAANSDLGSSVPGANHSSYTFTVDITGGFIYCASSEGDCLDSNKNFTISGGTLVVLGSLTQQDNTAVDTDGSFNIQGGEILTIGQSGMLTNPTTTQSYCSWIAAGTATASSSGSTGSGSSQRPGQIQRPGMGGSSSSGSVVSNNKQVTITDASGNVLLSVAVQWDTTASGSARYVLYSSPDLVSGSRYTLTVGTMESVTGGSNITTPGVPVQPETPETDETSVPTTPSTDPSSSTSSGTSSSSSTVTPPNSSEGSESSSVSLPPAPPDASSSASGGIPPPPPDVSSNMGIPYRLGDVDENGGVNATDALWVLQAAVSKRSLTVSQTLAANVDGNQVVNAADALYILQYAVGKIAQFPAEIA